MKTVNELRATVWAVADTVKARTFGESVNDRIEAGVLAGYRRALADAKAESERCEQHGFALNATPFESLEALDAVAAEVAGEAKEAGR